MKNKINILGHWWTIKHADIVDDEDSDALCEPSTKVISLKKGISKATERENLIHEIFHAVLFEVGISDQHISIDQEHFVIGAIILYITTSKDFKKLLE
jgi:hypothetical protein